MDTEIDDALSELLDLKNCGYVGIDVRIRDGKANIYTVNSKEEDFPENTSDDDITRLKEKLELLKQIDALLEKLEKYDRDTEYGPYPYVPWPVPPYEPWVPYTPPYNPPYEPTIPWWPPTAPTYRRVWDAADTADENIKIEWTFFSPCGDLCEDGSKLW